MDKLPPPLSAKVVGSFAYKTVKDRLPVILTKVIDVLFRDRNEIAQKYGEGAGHNTKMASEETKAVIGRLSKLRNEMQTDKCIVPLESSAPDVPAWNQCIREYTQGHGAEPSWFESPWLLVECYLYRRIKEAFELTTLLRELDPFLDQKQGAFKKAADTVTALSSYLLRLRIPPDGEERALFVKEYFVRFVELSLWGNKCDLSLSSGEDVATSSDPLRQTDSLRSNILANDSQKLYDIVMMQRHLKDAPLTMHLILDNAGFELFSDLCLLDFLTQADLVQTVYLHVKEMPWFVSDVLEHDFHWLLNYLKSHENPDLRKLGLRWLGYYDCQQWKVARQPFWTLPHDYARMSEVDSELYSFLSQSDLILFKGDLNYRKLMGDLNWDPVTPFHRALRGFKPAPLCALRTIKAEVVTGLSPQVLAQVSNKFENWMYSGEFALIQCSN